MGAAPMAPGDFVECISVANGGRLSGFRTGTIYTVSSVGEWYGQPWLNCAGMPTPLDLLLPPVPGWCASAFRPVYRRDETLTARLLSDIPADTPASPEEVVA